MLGIATRGSALALWQARTVQQQLQHRHPALASELVTIRTTGDRITDVPLSSIGERGLFTRELDNALFDRRAALAVHSLKDVPTVLPEGLVVAAILERADPRDAWVARDGTSTLTSLAGGAVVGTSSLRRRAMLAAARSDLVIRDVRGNLDTRLEKLAAGQYDALILARAGLERLGRQDAITATLAAPEWLPAPGQGAIVVVARADDAATLALARVLDHRPTSMAVRAERMLLRTLEGGCQVPIGALASIDGDQLTLHGAVAALDGSALVRGTIAGSTENPEELGRRLAQQLLEDGGDAILSGLRDDLARHSLDAPTVTPP